MCGGGGGEEGSSFTVSVHSSEPRKPAELKMIALLLAVTSDVQVDFDDRASFSVKVNGKLWLESSALRLFAGHQW